VAEIFLQWLSGCFWGTKVYIGGRSTSVAARGAQETGGAPRRGGRALLSLVRLDCFLTCTPSPLDHVRSKNHAPEGFILFGLRLIFLFFEILKQKKNKTTIRVGPPVSRLVPKMI